MARGKNKPLSEKYFREIEERVKDYFSSQNQDNIKKALTLCEEHGIDSNQFRLYFEPEEDNNGNENNGEHTNINKISDLAEIVQKTISAPTEITTPETTQNKNNTQEKIIFYNSFPYKKRELITLPKISLARITNGCLSSYSSMEIIKVFNPREYLAKMFGVTNLKKDNTYLAEIQSELLTKTINIDDAFYNFVKYLDKIAYKENGWINQTKKFNKDKYSTAKSNQRERTNNIPEIEKAKFIKSIFYKPEDYIRNHDYIHGKNPDHRLMSGTKTGYVNFLMEQLMTKWNNLDTVR